MAELVHSAQNFMNAEDVIIAKKRKRAKKMELIVRVILNKVLVQRRDGQEKRKTETTRQARQYGINSIRP